MRKEPTQLNDKHGLLWQTVGAAIEKGDSYRWNGYVISRHRTITESNGTYFMLFDKKEISGLRRDPDHMPKLHVALFPENAADINGDIQSSFNAILHTFIKHKIETFKIILPSKLKEFSAAGQHGKIFTVYLSTAELANKRDEIAKDIDHVIRNARQYPPIQPAQNATTCATRTDVVIPGCHFVTYASNRTREINCSGLFLTGTPDSAASSFNPSPLEPKQFC